MSTDRRLPARLRTLHVACMPFPTPQGTQAIVGMMLRALRDHGHDAQLLTYAHGEAPDAGARQVEPLRLADWPRVRSARSGPSLGKVALDLRMVAALRAQLKQTPAELVIAHNVEAAWVCAAASRVPWVYYAHTSMRDELPYYLPPQARDAGRAAGDLLDRGALLRSVGAFALTPTLAERLAPLHAHVETVLPPFEIPTAPGPSRAEARASLRLAEALAEEGRVAVYAGNLDGYQGTELLIDALRCASGSWHLLVATASDTEALERLAARAGVRQRVSFAPLATERDRALAHAAADVTVVPRRAPGGLPIKLLDGLARGLPVVATRRAVAGLALGEPVLVVDDDDAHALARGVERAFHTSGERDGTRSQRALTQAGFTTVAFAARFERACRAVLAHAGR